MGEEEMSDKIPEKAASEPAPPKGPRGVPGRRQGKVSLQIKRAWKAGGKRSSLKAFAEKHRPEQAATWKTNKAGGR